MHTRNYTRFWNFITLVSKIKVYKKVLREVAEKYDGAEDLIDNIIDETCSQGKLSAEEVIYFLVSFLAVK